MSGQWLRPPGKQCFLSQGQASRSPAEEARNGGLATRYRADEMRDLRGETVISEGNHRLLMRQEERDNLVDGLFSLPD